MFQLLSSYASRSIIRLRALLKQIMFHRTLHLRFASKSLEQKELRTVMWRPGQISIFHQPSCFFSWKSKDVLISPNPPFKRGQIGRFFLVATIWTLNPSIALRLHCWWSLLHMHCWAPESFSTTPCRRIPYPQGGGSIFRKKHQGQPEAFNTWSIIYGICTYIYLKNQRNVAVNTTIDGSYGQGAKEPNGDHKSPILGCGTFQLAFIFMAWKNGGEILTTY